MQLTIVGAGPGISQGIARLFGKKGFKIGLISLDEKQLQGLVQDLANEGITAMCIAANAADEAALTKALLQIQIAFGPAEVYVYNASSGAMGDILEQDWADISRHFDTNVGGAFHLAKFALPRFLQQNSGKLFFTGGGLALHGDPQMIAQSIGKAGMRNLVQALAKRVQGTDVHVATVTVCGYVQPQAPKYNPDAIAEVYWRLYEQEAGSYEEEVIY